MHQSSILRMKWFVKNYKAKTANNNKIKVLDVGSYDVNGSYKSLFDPEYYDYTGLDMEAGPNVDFVPANPYNWSEISNDSYDIVISGQAFEHIEFFWVTMSEMTRVLKKDGLICIVAPNGFEEHRHPVDCYRFFTDGMIALARYVSLTPLHAHTNSAPTTNDKSWYSSTAADTMLVATKPYSGETVYVDLKNYKCTPADQKELLSGFHKSPVSTMEKLKKGKDYTKNLIKKVFLK